MSRAQVLDLFREWDTDGDGEVSRKEFHKAMPLLGLEVPKKDIDILFDQWDVDGGGSLSLREMQKILKAPKTLPGGEADKLKGAASAVKAASKLAKKAAGALRCPTVTGLWMFALEKLYHSWRFAMAQTMTAMVKLTTVKKCGQLISCWLSIQAALWMRRSEQ